MRFYYTDPLLAAYVQKYHDIKVENLFVMDRSPFGVEAGYLDNMNVQVDTNNSHVKYYLTEHSAAKLESLNREQRFTMKAWRIWPQEEENGDA